MPVERSTPAHSVTWLVSGPAIMKPASWRGMGESL
jgi:hypothetical protein